MGGCGDRSGPRNPIDFSQAQAHIPCIPQGVSTSNIRRLQVMARITDKDKNVFSDAEKTFSDRFTDKEVNRIHEMALELDAILTSMKSRYDLT
jgi:hypothetical protein